MGLVRGFLFALLLTGASNAWSKSSGLPIPRFVSLRSSEVNMRVGPGHHFPTDWVYRRVNLPLEVIAEFGDWRKVRDMDGTQGWIHKSLLSGYRYVMFLRDNTPLHVSDDEDARVVAKAQNGVMAKLVKCEGDFCYVHIRQVGAFKGWVKRFHLWGVSDKD